MNRFGEDNLKNIKALVENGTGVKFDHKQGYRISARSLLIAALIVVLATASVFAAYRISLSKKVIDLPDNDERGMFISMPFGLVQSPASEFVKEHAGVDFPAEIGTPVLAAADGTVIDTDFVMAYGNYVIIEHADGFSTVYAHMDEILCEKGQEVAQGDEIGTVGTTGMSTGPHLHFELRLDGEAVDPAEYWNDPADDPEDPPEGSGDPMVSPEFMELLESYEKAADEYLDFLKSYDETDEKQNEEFREISTGYLDFDRQLIEWEKKGLNEAEEKAYKEVLDRIGEKWIEAGVAAG